MKTQNNNKFVDWLRLFFIFQTLICVTASTNSNTNNQTSKQFESPGFDDENNIFLQKYAYFKSFNQVSRFVLDSAHEKWPGRQQDKNLLSNFGNNSSVKEKQLKNFGARDAIMIVIAAIALFIAAGGGIGGGGVLVPLYILVGQFSTISAVALSNVTVMGGALANLSCNIRRRNQFIDRPLIDWDLIMIMEGPTILGAILGGYLNKLIPSWMTGLFLLLLLIQMAWVLIKKGIKMYAAESRMKLIQSNHQNFFRSLQKQEDSEITRPLLQNEIVVSQGDDQQPNVQLKGSGEKPKIKVHVTEHIKCSNQPQGVMRCVILDKCKTKEQGGVLNDQEVHWNPMNTIKFPMICSLAGLVAGMFGVGGGIVKAPLMLAMGVPPDVAAATSATMILFTAGSASTIYVSFGAVPVTYGVLLFMLGFIVTIGGQLLVYQLVNVSGRRSVIALSMGIFMLCAAVMMGIHVVVIMINLIKNHLSWLTINQVCG
eukprot:TRINITY_DN9505_c0_g2_i8.p1 TRINITY_DN9505_c0_g2~~TRINITY_DN9505_c0_g2_i8.p1  ORF type:complete len:484 (-),score=38.01 TRINITY_DN9505_c0_g2_i8:268-1719(-)